MESLKQKLETAIVDVINNTEGKPAGMNVYRQGTKIIVDPDSVVVAMVTENLDDPEGSGNRTATVSVTMRGKPESNDVALDWFEKSVYFGEEQLSGSILDRNPTLNANLIVYGQMSYATDSERGEFISTFSMDLNINQLPDPE